jgi:hypothetical protein
MINACVAGARDAGVHLAIHVCRGNNAGMWMGSGSYDAIADAIFKRASGFAHICSSTTRARRKVRALSRA